MLSSLKILDFTTLLPGPYATMMLSDLGAHVLRVEAPTRPDPLRANPPFDDGEGVAHSYLNRSKDSIALNLKQPDAVVIVKRLINEYDILIEQFRPGVMERLGLDYHTLSELNPRLIYCSITGYGQTGPMSIRAGHDINYLAISGIASYTGRLNSGPIPLGVQIADVSGGSLHAVIAILAAAIHREQTGKGQAIDVSMTDASFALNALAGSRFLSGGLEPEPEKMLLNGGSFYDYYLTKDGRYLAVGSLEPQFRKQLCIAIDRQDLLELSESRCLADQKMFKDKLIKVFKSKELAEWQKVFSEKDACVEPVLKFSESCCHPQIIARKLVVDVPKPDGSTQRQIGHPVKYSSFSPKYRHIGAKLGAQTNRVLQKTGYSKDEITLFMKKGVFG